MHLAIALRQNLLSLAKKNHPTHTMLYHHKYLSRYLRQVKYDDIDVFLLDE